MSEVYPNLVVGGIELCDSRGGAAIHASKHPCHVTAVGYKGSLPQSHPEYLVARRGDDLYLNIVDPPVPLFRRESFDAALDFVDELLPKGRLAIHCNNGLSRAPSIALLWLAKRAKVIPGGSFPEAQAAFTSLYPTYAPGQGITTYLTDQWQVLG